MNTEEVRELIEERSTEAAEEFDLIMEDKSGPMSDRVTDWDILKSFKETEHEDRIEMTREVLRETSGGGVLSDEQ